MQRKEKDTASEISEVTNKKIRKAKKSFDLLECYTAAVKLFSRLRKKGKAADRKLGKLIKKKGLIKLKKFKKSKKAKPAKRSSIKTETNK